jgi:cytochrome c oxidase assembly protein subunit 11
MSTPSDTTLSHNRTVLKKLCVVVVGMFAFGYALVPLYQALCEATGINILALAELETPGQKASVPSNTQIDKTRTITVEFDANTRGGTNLGGKGNQGGIWDFKPAVRSIQVHPGELTTVVYEFQNTQNRRMNAQAIPSYAPQQASPFFNKVECFCFQQYTLDAGEKKSWPVAFVIDPKLSKDVTTITLSYTFFEVGGSTNKPAVKSAATVKLGGAV